MPYKKTIELPTGDTGEHLEIGYFHVDYIARTSSAHVHLWKSRAHRLRGAAPQRQTLAKIRLEGALFEKYLSDAAIATAKISHRDQFYAAAKADPQSVTSDWQMPGDAPLFSGGIDV